MTSSLFIRTSLCSKCQFQWWRHCSNDFFLALNSVLARSTHLMLSKWYQLLWCDFWLKNYKFLKSTSTLAIICPKMLKSIFVHNFFGKILRKFLWLPSSGTSFNFLTSLLTTWRGVGHLDPQSSHSQKIPFEIGLKKYSGGQCELFGWNLTKIL